MDQPAHETVATPARKSTDPMPGSIETVALHGSGTATVFSADAPTDVLGHQSTVVHQTPPTRQIQPGPIQPGMNEVRGEVRSLPTTSSLRSSPLVKAINVAAGALIFLIAAGLLLWYVGIGRQRPHANPSQQEPAVQSTPSNPDQSSATPPVTTSQNAIPSAEQITADTHPRVDPKTTAIKASEPAPIQPKAETAALPATSPAPVEAPVVAKPGPGPAAPAGDEHVRRGRDLLNSGSYDRAITEFRNAARLEPSNDDVHYLAGIAYDKMGRRSEALEEFSRCKSGTYSALAALHVKRLNKELSKKR